MDSRTETATGPSRRDLREIIAEGDAFLPEMMTVVENGEGPTILVVGGIHGDEYEPQIVLRRLQRELDRESVSGRIIIIPSINFPGSQKGSRTSTIDGANMNRTFPGKPDGNATERLSHFLSTELFPQCDLLIDLHTGGAEYRVVPMIFGFSNPECVIDDARVEALMDSWGYGFIQYVEGVPSTAVGSALSRNIASVETEGGSGGDVDGAEVDAIYDALLRGLRSIGVITSNTTSATNKPIRVRVSAENQSVAPRDGIVQHLVTLGQFVRAGDRLAVLHPVAANDEDGVEVRSSVDGYVLRLNANAYIRQGSLISNTGTPFENLP